MNENMESTFPPFSLLLPLRAILDSIGPLSGLMINDRP